jgi:hypothetical protein
MYEPTHGNYALNPRNWLQVLVYLALPILLFGLGVVWPLVHPPAQSTASIAPTAANTTVTR